MTVRAIANLGPYTCDCGAVVWRARSPEGYAQTRLVLEEHDGGAWIMSDDGHYQAARVGLDHGDLRIHHHYGEGEHALGDVADLSRNQ